MKKKLNKLGVENSLWNNIRANKGSGKAPTKEMLKQEKKIKAKYDKGGITEETETTETPKKPLVNWFNRTKEFEYEPVENINGKTMINSTTGKPLMKTKKVVTAPDSFLSSGFKKTINKEEYINKNKNSSYIPNNLSIEETSRNIPYGNLPETKESRYSTENWNSDFSGNGTYGFTDKNTRNEIHAKNRYQLDNNPPKSVNSENLDLKNESIKTNTSSIGVNFKKGIFDFNPRVSQSTREYTTSNDEYNLELRRDLEEMRKRAKTQNNFSETDDDMQWTGKGIRGDGDNFNANWIAPKSMYYPTTTETNHSDKMIAFNPNIGVSSADKNNRLNFGLNSGLGISYNESTKQFSPLIDPSASIGYNFNNKKNLETNVSANVNRSGISADLSQNLKYVKGSIGVGRNFDGNNYINAGVSANLKPNDNNFKKELKVTKTKIKNKDTNAPSELTPRFLAMGGTINNQAMKTNKYSNGGTIHIKPENKGKFNATKKATGKTTEELTHSKNPVTKKRAIFAQNAAKWKHAEGGEIEKLGTDNTNVNIPKKDLTISRFKTGSKNYNEIPEAFRNLPLQTGQIEMDNTPIDVISGGRGAYQVGKGFYNLSKAMTPNIVQIGQSVFDLGYHPKSINRAKTQITNGIGGFLFAKGGRVLPKYADAGWLTKNKAGVGAGLGFAGDTTNLLFDNNVFGTRNEVTDSEGNVLGEAQSDAGSQTQGALSGALKGASAGAALGPWGMAGGALIGGVAGFLTADTGAEDKLNQIKRERNAQISFKNMLGKGPIENNSIQTNSQSLYANGGMKTLNQNHPEATEEVELGESAMLPNGMNLAFGGETHENGGLETNLPEGTRIFSDRIKSGKRTIASIAKPIQNKIEKLKDNNSKAGQNTIKLFENQLDNLFNEQEEIKQQQDMAQQRKYFAKGGLIKYSGLDGKPGVIQKPYSFAANFKEPKIEVPLINAKNIYAQGTIDPNNPSAREMLGIKPNYVPANSDQANYENSLKEQNSLHNYLGMTQDDMMKMVNNRSLTKTPEGYYYMNNNVPNGGKGDFDKNLDQPGDTPPPSEPRFNKGDIGTAGALGTSLLGNLIQRSNLNKVAPPRTLVAPTFTAGRTPVKADYSADLQSADNQFNAARRGVMMNSGNYSTQAGNLGQLRAEQLRNRSKILQNQNNANAVLMNEYQKAQADAINKNALSNYTTDQENMENLYNYNLWKTGQTNAADASAFNTSGQMFNNMVTGQNQLDAAEMYRRMYAQKVRDDLAFKAMGGTVRNYFAKGGTVYRKALENLPSVDKAAQMDAEYASYLDAKGQPLQDTFKSKVTGLDYKVLPRKEKDLYAANLWKEAHGSAPTKKQVAATTKAIEGKKTSSPGAKTVADTHNSQVPQLEATLPEVVITGKRSLNPQQMMDNKFGKPQVSNQLPAVPSKPVPDWVNKANNAKPNFNQPNVNEPVNEKPVVNKPKLQTETPNWLKNPLQPKFNRNEVGEPDNSGSSFNPDTNESKIEKGKKYVNNVLKPAIQEGRKNLNEMDVNVAKKANIRSLSNIGENISKKIEKNWKERGEAPSPSEAAKLLLAGYNENYKQIIPTSIRSLAKDIVNNNLGTNMKITEDDLTQTEKTAILELVNRKENLSKKDKNYSKSINSYNDYINDSLDGNQWSDIKNIRNTLGKFNPKQDGDTLRIKEAYNFNEKENNKVIKQYGDWVKDWKEKGYSSALAYVRASGSAFGSAGSTKGDDSKGTPVDIKLYNPKKRTLNK